MPAVRSLIAALLTLAATFCPLSASAQMVDRCLAIAQAPRLVHPAALKPTEVRLTFIGHSTWLIESPGAVKIATDYNDYIRPSVVPDIATMNRRTPRTTPTSPSKHQARVARRQTGGRTGQARHDGCRQPRAQRPDLANIRDWNGACYLPRQLHLHLRDLGQMCIGHLGHLHHTLTDQQQIAQIGQLDVVMVPVDGS